MSNEINIEELERLAKELINSAPWTSQHRDLSIVFKATMSPNAILSLIDRLKKAESELERERIRLAACGVVAMADTPESAAEAREMRDEYRSASCDDVARRVDECMTLRAERDALARDAERYRWIREHRIGVKWCELYAGGPALDEVIDSTMKALPAATAKARFDRAGGHEEPDPVERLRFFCAQAMGGQDWLDVEPFFDAVIAQRDATAAKLAAAQGMADTMAMLRSEMIESGVIDASVAPMFFPESIIPRLRTLAELEGQEPVGEVIHSDVLSNAEGKYRHEFLSDFRIGVQAELYARPVAAEPVNVDFGKRGENMFFNIGNQSFLLDYKPEEQDEFDFMKTMLLSAFSRITHGVKTESQPVNARLLEALKTLRDALRDHPEYAQLSEEQEEETGGDTAEFSYLVRVADEAIAAADAQQERLLQDMHDAGREIDRVMAENPRPTPMDRGRTP